MSCTCSVAAPVFSTCSYSPPTQVTTSVTAPFTFTCRTRLRSGPYSKVLVVEPFAIVRGFWKLVQVSVRPVTQILGISAFMGM